MDVEASRQARLEKQKSRYRDRGGIFVPAQTNPLLDILLARGPNGESPSKVPPKRGRAHSSSPLRSSPRRVANIDVDETHSAPEVVTKPAKKRKGRSATTTSRTGVSKARTTKSTKRSALGDDAETKPGKEPSRGESNPPLKGAKSKTKGQAVIAIDSAKDAADYVVAEDDVPRAGPSNLKEQLPEKPATTGRRGRPKAKKPIIESEDEDDIPLAKSTTKQKGKQRASGKSNTVKDKKPAQKRPRAVEDDPKGDTVSHLTPSPSKRQRTTKSKSKEEPATKTKSHATRAKNKGGSAMKEDVQTLLEETAVEIKKPKQQATLRRKQPLKMDEPDPDIPSKADPTAHAEHEAGSVKSRPLKRTRPKKDQSPEPDVPISKDTIPLKSKDRSTSKASKSANPVIISDDDDEDIPLALPAKKVSRKTTSKVAQIRAAPPPEPDAGPSRHEEDALVLVENAALKGKDKKSRPDKLQSESGIPLASRKATVAASGSEGHLEESSAPLRTKPKDERVKGKAPPTSSEHDLPQDEADTAVDSIPSKSKSKSKTLVRKPASDAVGAQPEDAPTSKSKTTSSQSGQAAKSQPDVPKGQMKSSNVEVGASEDEEVEQRSCAPKPSPNPSKKRAHDDVKEGSNRDADEDQVVTEQVLPRAKKRKKVAKGTQDQGQDSDAPVDVQAASSKTKAEVEKNIRSKGLKSSSRKQKENQDRTVSKPAANKSTDTGSRKLRPRKPMPRLSMFPVPPPAADSDDDPIDFLSR